MVYIEADSRQRKVGQFGARFPVLWSVVAEQANAVRLQSACRLTACHRFTVSAPAAQVEGPAGSA